MHEIDSLDYLSSVLISITISISGVKDVSHEGMALALASMI